VNVVGVDLSLTATGIADANGARTISLRTKGMERLAAIRDVVWIATHVSDLGSGAACNLCAPVTLYGAHPDLLVIEGYSMGSHSSHAHELGELGGVVRLKLWEAGLPTSTFRRPC